jgi:6-pyruvoyltetrahydropterin/6-carboxytetrahydropterin synthase
VVALFLVRVRARFEAAHHLLAYRGAPEPNHGHSWLVEAVLTSDHLDGEGMAFDFVEAKRVLDDLARRFDHGEINAVAPFDRLTPSAENVAIWFFDRLRERLAVSVREVTLWEGPDCAVTYRPGRGTP